MVICGMVGTDLVRCVQRGVFGFHTHIQTPDSFVPLPSGSVITTVDAKKSKVKKGETQKYGFMIRFMQMTRFIERCVHPIPWVLFFRVPLEVVSVQTGGARST